MEMTTTPFGGAGGVPDAWTHPGGSGRGEVQKGCTAHRVVLFFICGLGIGPARKGRRQCQNRQSPCGFYMPRC